MDAGHASAPTPGASAVDAARIAALRAELERAFRLRAFSVDVLDQPYTLHTAENIEQLIAGISDEEFRIDERLPYWAELWHSALALSEFCAASPLVCPGAAVLEIGCGLGLPGLVCLRRGAAVTFSDHDAQGLATAELNARVNCPATMMEFLPLDFRTPPARTWPLVIASDVIYEKRFVEPLAAFLAAVLAPGGTAVLAEPQRGVAEPFFALLDAHGWRRETALHSTFLHGRAVDIGVHCMTRG